MKTVVFDLELYYDNVTQALDTLFRLKMLNLLERDFMSLLMWITWSAPISPSLTMTLIIPQGLWTSSPSVPRPCVVL